MATLKKKFLGQNQVDETKIRLSNTGALKARNAADSADVDIIRVNASDVIEFPSVPQVVGTPSASGDVATVGYVQSIMEGLDPKEAVRVATTANLADLEGLLTIDGVTLVAGDRVLVKNQNDAEDNGIYIAAVGAWSRSADANSSIELIGAYTLVRAGTAQQGQGYVCSVSDSFVLGTDPCTFVIFKAAADFIGGDGIDITGTTISVDLATNSGLEFSSNELQVDLSASGGLELSGNEIAINLEATNPTLQIATNELGVKIFSGSGLEASASGLGIDLEASNPSLQISSNELGIKFDAAGALEKVAAGVKARVDAATVKINGSNNLESLKSREEIITLDGTDITNQYVDLAHAVHGVDATNNSVSLVPVGGILQEKGVDYTVSLTGGSGGVTRITFSGDLATSGAAELVASDKLVISYSYLT